MIKYLVYLIGFMFILTTGSCSKSNSNKESNSKKADVVIKIDTKGEPTLVIFDAAHCTYCKKLKNDIDNNPQVKKRLKQMSVYFVHIDEDNKYMLMHNKEYIELSTKEMEKALGYGGGTPFVVIMDKDSNIITKLPGYLRPKYFSKALDYVLTKSYDKMSLGEYLNSK